MREMFVHEARIGMSLAHPHICAIHEFGHERGRFFLAMEWVRGVSLRRLIDLAPGRLPVPMILRILADAGSALHYAHTLRDGAGRPLRIIHRDVSPENIMVGTDGAAKLLDFGVAKAANQRRQTEAGTVKGKFAYISPEQYQGEELDGRSDVFSLGVCLYEALTGESLYARANEFETVAAIVLDPHVPSIREVRPELSPRLDSIVLRALAKDRDERYATMDALVDDLEFQLQEEGPFRHADVARLLAEIVPARHLADPKLDTAPPTGAFPTDPPPGPVDLRQASLQADAENDLEKLLERRRRSSSWPWILAVLVIVGSVAVIAWVALRRQAVEAPPALTPEAAVETRP
jgi:serine/threonine protein kinase